jgi:tetratricopeptide (TPR) repeat protein
MTFCKHSGMRILSVYMLIFFAATNARADIFHLADGGEVVGQLVERGDDGEYIIKPVLGGSVTLAKDQVADVVRQSEHQAEYEKQSRALPDTVAAHRAMADWCKQHQLSEQSDHHLRRILELDPDDEQARTSLGYQRHQGKWLTRDEIMAERGMYYYDGAYRTAQDIALRKRDQAGLDAEVEWFRNLKLWRGWLDSRRPGRAEEAQVQIDRITEPEAATSLVKIANQERDEHLRLMWMRVLSQVRHPATMRKLIQFSLSEPDRETRLQCVEYLLSMNDEIDISIYVKALNAKDNHIINISAEALGLIGNPDAISPLIDALVTTHKIPLADQGEMSASFSPDGSGGAGLSAGSKPKFVNQDFQNPEVRRALIKLSGDQDFDFSETAWRRWFVNRQIEPDFIDTRRDQ